MVGISLQHCTGVHPAEPESRLQNAPPAAVPAGVDSPATAAATAVTFVDLLTRARLQHRQLGAAAPGAAQSVRSEKDDISVDRDQRRNTVQSTNRKLTRRLSQYNKWLLAYLEPTDKSIKLLICHYFYLYLQLLICLD